MTIQTNSVVELEYTLKNKQGEVLDTSEGRGPLVYMHGQRNIIQGLERELTGKKANDQLQVVIAPEDAYGVRSDDMIQDVPLTELSGIQNLAIGMQLQAQTSEGVQVLTVIALDDSSATLDGNHPLAGEELHFSVTVKSIRPATADELAHGHVHGPGGHHH
jgi:FKBP-type peptidyl-prolyl cis-trans isomerase SlyD